MTKGGVVKSQEAQRPQIENPHRQWVFVEEKAVTILGFAKFLLALLSEGNFSLQFVIRSVQLSRPFLDLQLQFAAQAFLFLFDTHAFLQNSFDMHHADQQQEWNEQIK